jgi:hypothetical protein
MATQTDEPLEPVAPINVAPLPITSVSTCISTQTALSAVEGSLYKNKHSIKPKVEKPVVQDTAIKHLPKLLQIRTKPSKEMKSVKLTDDTDSVKAKIITWLGAQIDSYKAEGEKFCRLEWITQQYTFLISNFAGSNHEVINNVLTRNAPPDTEPGHAALQTARLRQRDPRKTESVGVDIRKLYEMNRQSAYGIVTGEANVQCKIPIDRVEQHFKNCSRKPVLNASELDEISEKCQKRRFLIIFTMLSLLPILKRSLRK